MEALVGDAVDSAAPAGRAVLGPVQESGPACLPGIPGSIPGSELSHHPSVGKRDIYVVSLI